MVFPSVPIYFDSPNWPQQQGIDGGGSCLNNGHHQLPPTPPSVGVGGTSSIKSGSMTDRARLPKIPQPETALKCPRCESTNTKFCYFNNYSLTQPRHLCKTCRRYWTRGGALRDVPVGGGCRKNKRSSTSKGSRSRSPADNNNGGNNNNYSSTSTTSVVPPPTSGDVMMSQFPPQHFLSHDAAFQAAPPVGGNCGNLNGGVEFGVGFVEQWRPQQGRHHQFPFLNGVEPENMYTFESVKVEDTRQGLNLSRNFLGGDQNQYWVGGGANAWTELAGFTNSSSSTRPLL